MSPIGAVIFSVLIMSGIMTAGDIHSKYGIPMWLWVGANGALLVLFAVVELRAFMKKRKGNAEGENTEA